MKQKQKAAFFELEPWEEMYIKQRLKNLHLTFSKEPLTEKNVVKNKDADILGVFIYSQINKKTLSYLKKLKFIAAMSTGYDHIDVKECSKRKIIVANVPHYGENTVAEHTFALILSISRKICDSHERILHDDFSLHDLRGFDLKGKTLGLIGCGNIGQHVARIANGFEMNVLVYEPHQHPEKAKKYGFQYVSIDALLKSSDIISLHCPYNKETHHLINSKNINKMKKGAILINTARGQLVETDSLVKALQNGTISYAGLDVLEEECFIKEEKQLLSKEFPKTCNIKTVMQDHILIHLPNVIFTPHNAFNSEEALKRILDTTIDNILGYSKGKIINRVA